MAIATASGSPTTSASTNPYKVSFSVIHPSLISRSLRMISERNATIGFVVGRLIVAGETVERTDAEIYNIAVVTPEQRRGCGQSLFDAFCERCRKRDVSNIWLEVRESNAAAIRFYEKNGFERVQSRRHFYENPREHAILMRLALKNSRG